MARYGCEIRGRGADLVARHEKYVPIDCRSEQYEERKYRNDRYLDSIARKRRHIERLMRSYSIFSTADRVAETERSQAFMVSTLLLMMVAVDNDLMMTSAVIASVMILQSISGCQ